MYSRSLLVAVVCMALHVKSSFRLGHCRSLCRRFLCVPVFSASLEHTLEIVCVSLLLLCLACVCCCVCQVIGTAGCAVINSLQVSTKKM